MSFFADEQKLTEFFIDAWNDVGNPHRLVPIEIAMHTIGPNSSGELVRFRVKKSPSTPFSISPSQRNYGSVIVQYVCKSGSGPGRALNVADAVREIFAPGYVPVRLGSLRCKTPSVSGPHEEGTLATINVDIPWHSDYSA